MIEIDDALLEAELDAAEERKQTTLKVRAMTSSVRTKVTTTPARVAGPLLTPVEQWTWSELRDYVIAKIVEIHGPIPRNAPKENAVFTRFAGKYGELAGPIAKYAFEVQPNPGFWGGQHTPIAVGRFAKACDESFADVIAKKLVDHQS